MDQYFSRMQSLTNSKELPARIRFLLQNTVEQRANNWAARKAYSDNGPKTINQVRRDAVKVSSQLQFDLNCVDNFKKDYQWTLGCPAISLDSVPCRIWVFLFHLKTMAWEMNSSWKTPPSYQQGSNLTEKLLVGWLICLDKCLVCHCFYSLVWFWEKKKKSH